MGGPERTGRSVEASVEGSCCAQPVGKSGSGTLGRKILLDTIAKNDNNLSAGRYKPWKEQETVVTESPAQLLKELADLETDTMKKVQELMEMAGDYE